MKKIILHKRDDGSLIQVPLDLQWHSQSENQPATIYLTKEGKVIAAQVTETIEQIKTLIKNRKVAENPATE